MDQKDFNRDMDSYLRKRKDSKGGFFSSLKSVPKVEIVGDDDQEEKPTDVPLEQVQAVLRGETVRPQETSREATTVEFDEEDFTEQSFEQEPRRGFWSRLWQSIGMTREEVIGDEDEEVPDFSDLTPKRNKDEIDGDIKDMLKTCVQWVNRLPPEDIQDIRRSDDYQEFKRLLDKYGLLKK